ncbi:MAG: DNA topoisomerase IV subunit A [Bacilli bacterium]|nr:DNA topoisomerase IV subunit A [Bacilli bacterium]
MSRNKKKITDIIKDFVNESIIEDNLENLVGERFGRYSKYIIQDRALPDARDGLKPVQRRILFAMFRLGMFHNRPYKKSARIVGEVIGKYHPHGDTSVYDAMVRLSQNFKMLLPLIDMHGNNGSIDGDPAAAMRYTEARLSSYAEFLLQDINKKTVGFVPNFDDEEYEPTVLPAKFPNLLANGASGISAGYATEIPPHNIDELITATIFRINHPECSLDEIMNIIQGPDFPTGGIVQGLDGIKEAYDTGKGKIVLKAKTEIVEEKDLIKLIVSEIPYEVNKAVLVKRMNDVFVAKNIDGIIDIRDESDRQGLRIVVDMKKDANPEYIRDFFFKSTDLQINYNFNMVAISDKRPVLMGLLSILDAYIDHQKEILTNRSNFELKSSQKRLHIVEGLISMTSILDSVIKTIRNSNNKKDAKENLVSTYSFSEEQAEAIVMLQLYRLTNTDIVALENEQQILKSNISFLNDILSNENLLLDLIKKELLATLKVLTTPRKTLIEHKIEDLVVEVKKLIPKEDVYILITNDGYIKRMSPKNYKTDEETKLKEEDIVIATYKATTLDTLLLFTDLGNYVYLPIQDIPEVKHKDFGYNVSTLANIEASEKIMFNIVIDDFEKERYILFTTKNGLIKRTPIKDLKATRYSRALKATKIRTNDRLVSVDIENNLSTEVLVITKEGYMNRYNADEISIMAPPSFGVKAIETKNRPSDEIICGRYINSKDLIVLLTSKGAIKRMVPDEVVKGRKNNVGKQYIQPTKGNPTLIVDADIIHKANANIDLDCYLGGTKGFQKIEFALLKNATAQSGKKIAITNIGTPQKFLIARNNNDIE